MTVQWRESKAERFIDLFSEIAMWLDAVSGRGPKARPCAHSSTTGNLAVTMPHWQKRGCLLASISYAQEGGFEKEKKRMARTFRCSSKSLMNGMAIRHC